MAKWEFAQIEGKGERKTLTLDAWNAPFGRPRKQPLIVETIRSRVQTTRYPGSDKQTRHAFGTNWETTELRGRWMTKANSGLGVTANDIAEDWTAFVRDERTCRIAWGKIVSWTGFIEELEIARESEDEIAWKLKIQIDSRDDVVKLKVPAAYERPDNIITSINDFVSTATSFRGSFSFDLSFDFLEQLDNLAAALNGPSAEMNRLAGRFDDLEKASFATLQHFRSALTGFRTALITMRDVMLTTEIDSIMLVRTSQADLEWLKYQLDFDHQCTIALEMLGKLDRRAELANKNEASIFVTALDGDTWESISRRATGGLDKAGAIRDLNGVKYGEKPTPGESYLVQQ